MRPYLSFSLLAYNERATLAEAARRASAVLERCGRTYELVLVDDGSTDGSAVIAEDLARELPYCRTIHHPVNLGIGTGIRTCFFGTVGEWATWFPADLQADPEQLPRLLGLLDDCDVLVTYRDARLRHGGAARKVISWADRALVRFLFGLGLRDLHWIRFFRRELLERMRLACRSPSVDTEMVFRAKRMGARIHQAELPDRARRTGVARGASLRHLVASAADLVRLRLGARAIVGRNDAELPSAAWAGQRRLSA